MWHYGYEIVGGILIILSSAVSETMPQKWRLRTWIVFVVLGLIYIYVGIHLANQNEIEQTNRDHAIHDLHGQLEQSLLAQQYTKGQLDSLSLMVGRIGQPSPQGDGLAAAIKQMAQATAQNAADLKASNTDLCNRARASAEKIRVFQGKYQEAERTEMEQDYLQQRAASTDERHALFEKKMQRDIHTEQLHEAEFRSKYMLEAKYLRDLLMSRIPPKMSETLMSNNGQAEGNLTNSMLAGAFNEYGIATYLDELANAVCPQTAEDKKARQVAYRAIAARLREFGSQGNKFHERCMPNSNNPPSPTEISEWIDT